MKKFHTKKIVLTNKIHYNTTHSLFSILFLSLISPKQSQTNLLIDLLLLRIWKFQEYHAHPKDKKKLDSLPQGTGQNYPLLLGEG